MLPHRHGRRAYVLGGAIWSLGVLVLEIFFVRHLGWEHLMWFSHLGLMATVVAWWWPNAVFRSCVAMAVLMPDGVWNIDFGLGLLLGGSPTGATFYMFDPLHDQLHQRMSLFHVPLPFVAAFLVKRSGYHRWAWPITTAACWIIVTISWAALPEWRNVNWVHSFGDVTSGLPQPWQVITVMLGLPLAVYIPSHFLLRWWAKPDSPRSDG